VDHFFFSSRRRHTRFSRDWSSDVCSSDLLLRSLRELRTLGFPILVGTSNKSVIGHVLGVPVSQRLEGTAATVAAAIAYGADGVRVHDVRVMRMVSDMTDAVVRGRRSP